MDELTKAEEQVLQVLWELEYTFVKEIIEHWPEPKPAYNTISTFVRHLEDKGYVWHEPHGKSYKYYPIVSKHDYTKSYMKGLVNRYFKGSYNHMVSFFAKEEELSIMELEELIQELKKRKNHD